MLPITLRPDGRPAVVVGGGTVATRKAEALAAAGFPLLVVAASLHPPMRALIERCGGTAVERSYRAGDLAGAALAIAATGDDAVNARIVNDARAARVLVCDASAPERGDFNMTATVRAGDLTLSVDTGGASPAFARRIAAELRVAYGPQHAAAAATLAHVRTYVKAAARPDERVAVLRELAALPVDELAALNPSRAEHEADAAIARLRATRPVETPQAVCASRASALAMAQTRTVAARLAERGVATTILTLTTAGDRDRDRPIERLGSINVFVTELETALREGRADYAVHSCKDLPSELAGDMQIAAVSAREDPRDAFCSERYPDFAALPAGAVVGTSSPRRRLQLAALRPDLEYADIRGNVDTRLRKLREGTYDAIVLAMAGLNRLRLRASHTGAFPVDEIVPAAGQGALAIETRRGQDRLTAELRAAVNDPLAELCVACERAALRALRGGCSAPIGVHAYVEGRTIVAVGARVLEGGTILRNRVAGAGDSLDDAQRLGAELAAGLARAAGLVVLPRTRPRPSRIAGALRASGIDVIELHAGDEGPDPAERLPDMLLFASSGAVSAAERYLARLRALQRRPLVAAMGPESGSAASAAGFPPDAVAETPSTEAFARMVREWLAQCR